jgi:predicted RNA-binding protein
MIVLGDRDAMGWVLKHGRMAVNARVATLPAAGDRVVLYVSRGAHRNPTRDQAQVIGLGEVAGEPITKPIVIAGRTYARSFPLRLNDVAEPRCGLSFEELVPLLEFIRNKDAWGGAVRRPVVRLSEADYRLIETCFRAHRARTGSSRVRGGL